MTKTTLYHTPNGALAVHQSAGDGPPIVLVHGNSSSAPRVLPPARRLARPAAARRRHRPARPRPVGERQRRSPPICCPATRSRGGGRRQFRPRPGFVRRLEPWRPHPARGGEGPAAGARLRSFSARRRSRSRPGDGGRVPAQPGDGGRLLGRGRRARRRRPMSPSFFAPGFADVPAFFVEDALQRPTAARARRSPPRWRRASRATKFRSSPA